MTDKSSPQPSTDLRPDLLHGLEAYLFGGITVIMVLGLVGGWAGRSWILITGIVFLQVIGNAFLGRWTRHWKNMVVSRYTIGLWNWITTAVIIIVVGGYPSPFWLAFLVGSIVSGVMEDRTGVYLVTAFAVLALATPRLFTGLDMATATGIGMQLLTLLLTGLVVQKSASWLFFEQRKLHKAEENLRQSNDKLTFSVSQLEQHAREIGLLTTIGRLLQSCTTASETYDVIGSYMPELFPSETGAVFIYSPSRNDLEAQVTWGDFPEENGARIFSPDECWALRQGQIYRQDAAHPGLRCLHVKQLKPTPYLCVPMMARGEALGVLHIQMAKGESTAEVTMNTRTTEAISSIAASAAEYIALALANQILRETLRNQAIRDPLTGLFNRRYAEETLEREILRAERRQTPLGVIMLDIDRFKVFNDTHGHDAGDVVLQDLGAYLKTRVRGEDVACRYGGEEFLIIMSDVSLEDAQQRAEALRNGVKTLNLNYRGQPIGSITLSLGVAAFPQTARAKDTLLQVADAALYRAKAGGRDCVVVAEQAEGGEYE
jgi:diguanylate cyclase (GGDEF)-like protein